MAMKSNPDALFQKLAEQYAEAYGAELKQEQQALKQEAASPLETPLLDRRVKRLTQGPPRRRYAPALIAIAAALLLFVWAPWRESGPDLAPLPPQVGDSSGAAETPAPPTGEPADSEAAEGPTLAERWALLELDFVLPANFTVEAVEQDLARTVYYLGEQGQDDVVLTLEELTGEPDYSGLHEFELYEHLAYGLANGDFKVVSFEKDGILYVMTCRYDLQTLVDLSEAILI